MKSIINFMKTMLIMPIHWQAWLGILVTANIVVPMFYIHTLEAQVILATAIVGLMIMAFIFSMKGFVRLMGIGHFGWLPLVFWLGMRLEHAPADSLFGYWLMAVFFWTACHCSSTPPTCCGMSKASASHFSRSMFNN